MDSSEKKINIEEIMAEIRREIAEKGYKNDDISFSDIPVYSSAEEIATSNLSGENLYLLQVKYNIATHRPLKSSRAIGSLIIFVKKIIRKLIKFYIEPIVTDQNEINGIVKSCIQDLYDGEKILNHKVKHLENEIAQLKRKIETL